MTEMSRAMASLDDDEDMETDELFKRTQPIGNAINALAQAELAVAAVDDIDPQTRLRLDAIRRRVLGGEAD